MRSEERGARSEGVLRRRARLRPVFDRLRLVLAGFVAVAIATAVAVPAAAQDAPATPTAASEEVARRAIGELRSPYCPGLMLEVCPSAPAEALRDSIRVLAAEGVPAPEIVEWMIDNHGEVWRAVPKRRGIGAWAWFLPPFALVFGAGVLVMRLRGLRSADDTVTAAAPALTPEERDRLSAELAELEASLDEEDRL